MTNNNLAPTPRERAKARHNDRKTARARTLARRQERALKNGCKR